MARFYGEVKGNRGDTSRCGSVISGMQGHLRGWHTGVQVRLWVGEDGKDWVQVVRTGGSAGRDAGEVVAEWSE